MKKQNKTVIKSYFITSNILVRDNRFEIEVPTTFQFRHADFASVYGRIALNIWGSSDPDVMETKKIKLIIVQTGEIIDVDIVQLKFLATVSSGDLPFMHIWQDCR